MALGPFQPADGATGTPSGMTDNCVVYLITASGRAESRSLPRAGPKSLTRAEKEESHAVPKLDWCSRADRVVVVDWGRSGGRWCDLSRLERSVDAVRRTRSPRPTVSRPDQALGIWTASAPHA